MTITTKAALAAELGITKARVSQYVKAGLPVRSDGKVDREPALEWIARNNIPLNSTRDVGARRARDLTADARRRISPTRTADRNPVDAALLNGLAELVGRSGSIVAGAAIAAGLPALSAYVLSNLVVPKLWREADQFMARVGLHGVDVAFEQRVDPMLRANEPEWNKLAAERGEGFDEGAWERALTEAEDALV